jgi:hypothetical protein
VVVEEDEVALAVTEEVAGAEEDLDQIVEGVEEEEVLVIEAVEEEVLVAVEEAEAGVEVAVEVWEVARKFLLSPIVMQESSLLEERKMP